MVGRHALVVGTILVGAEKMWDATPAGQQGALARGARNLARLSVDLPVVVTIDNADHLDLAVAVTLVESLIERHDGQTLVVVVADPGSELVDQLRTNAEQGLTAGRVQLVEGASPEMTREARADLAEQLLPRLPPEMAGRIADRTINFAEVFIVAAETALIAANSAEPLDEGLALVDRVVDARVHVDRGQPSQESILIAWAGGTLHERQADQALAVLSAERVSPDPAVIRTGKLVRLTDPASRTAREEAALLPAGVQRAAADAVLAAAVDITLDPTAGLVERVVAARAAHQVRRHVTDKTRLLRIQLRLVQGLEDLADYPAGYRIAREALTETAGPPFGADADTIRDKLHAAVLRLAPSAGTTPGDPATRNAVRHATRAGAVIDLEARIWAAITLFRQPNAQARAAALALAIRAATDLNQLKASELTDSWRLQLAYAAAQTAHGEIAQQLLAPLIADDDAPERSDAARALLRVATGSQADLRLQIVLLEKELESTNGLDVEHNLRLHHAIAAAYARIGDYQSALTHANSELRLLLAVQTPDNPLTLTTRRRIANWTSDAGERKKALALGRRLLSDQQRILGKDHRETLSTTGAIAKWTAEAGSPRQGLLLMQRLLPDQQRVLGEEHPDVLATRHNIAVWTGYGGNARRAYQLLEELAPVVRRVHGDDDVDTLTTQNNVAYWARVAGDLPRALTLAEALLPHMQRVYGAGHPDTLAIRSNVATWTGETGDPRKALELTETLLVDRLQILGPDHPSTLITRHNIAGWKALVINPRTALESAEALLPDLMRVLGRTHPQTFQTRSNIAVWTEQTGNRRKALQLYRALLGDQQQVLGSNHPDTRATRSAIRRLNE
jgi:hypothetical protein